MSLRKLPPVLNIQFKVCDRLIALHPHLMIRQRFEHNSQNGKGTPKKIDAHIRLPASLNMLPYTTLGIKNEETEKDI